MTERVVRAGQRLGNYKLMRLLWAGTFADVYLAEHLYLNTRVAIKFLHPHPAGHGTAHLAVRRHAGAGRTWRSGLNGARADSRPAIGSQRSIRAGGHGLRVALWRATF